MTGGRVPAKIWRATVERAHPEGDPVSLPYTDVDAPIRQRGELENLIVRALDESPRPGFYTPRGFPHNRRIMRMNPDNEP